MIKYDIKKYNFVDSDLEFYSLNTELGVDPIVVTLGTFGAVWRDATNEFRVNLNTGIGNANVSQLILDDNGTLNLTNRVQHIGSVFFDIETRELKVYNGTEWVIIQQL